ncbi:hypothetical protein AEAC466_06230 [Asticcacaulis sp. AC466]|uniref:methyl-accepting chemotaxis protein n=1 Tax=Asticcacaulis sp. AC466 TaxID=1282362 RepID=UPI0003C41138|nr:methyl-accepting chemotaxis protein [Asticcacaulis sp. AC466]ESQ84645.1 hypothetical protein AEAC466_06230 [Asticcacaulis sp. AC466]
MKFSIGHKLAAASLVFVLAMGAFVAGAWASLSHLRHLQNRGIVLMQTSSAAQALSGQGAALYQIIADAEINHELDQTQTDWAKEKSQTEALFADLRNQLKEADETVLLEQAMAGYRSYINMFESEMMPVLKASDVLTPQSRALDGQIDDACVKMVEPLMALSKLTVGKANEADAAFDKLSGQVLMIGSLIGVLALLLGSAVNFVTVRHISLPLKRLAGLLHKLVSGEAVSQVPYENRRDEVGDIAHAVSAFKDNIAAVARLEAEQSAARARMESDNARAVQVLKSAEAFERQIKSVAARVGQTSTDLNTAALSLDQAARDADQRSTSMASATSQSSSNLQTVASATEELSASINEISRQVEETTMMTQAATAEARRTGQTVDNLTQAASKIGDVVALIQDIASQTNLLALNATIEAARAGEAGAGFAVVAGEVKNLSAQTSRAISEIRDHISSMQVVTEETVGCIKSISQTIERIDAVATSIAAGVTQQSAATADIANNVAQVANGADTINADLSQVSRASQVTTETSAEVLKGAGSLSEHVKAMSEEVDAFLGLIRVQKAA